MAVKGRVPVSFYGRAGGVIFSVEEIYEFAMSEVQPHSAQIMG